MPELNIRNVKNESNRWKRALGSMSEENIQMKTRLSGILQENFDLNLLPQVENFLTLLLKEEEFINLLRHNVAELDRHLSLESNANSTQVDIMRARLENQMITAETRFHQLRTDYELLFSLPKK